MKKRIAQERSLCKGIYAGQVVEFMHKPFGGLAVRKKGLVETIEVKVHQNRFPVCYCHVKSSKLPLKCSSALNAMELSKEAQVRATNAANAEIKDKSKHHKVIMNTMALSEPDIRRFLRLAHIPVEMPREERHDYVKNTIYPLVRRTIIGQGFSKEVASSFLKRYVPLPVAPGDATYGNKEVPPSPPTAGATGSGVAELENGPDAQENASTGGTGGTELATGLSSTGSTAVSGFTGSEAEEFASGEDLDDGENNLQGKKNHSLTVGASGIKGVEEKEFTSEEDPDDEMFAPKASGRRLLSAVERGKKNACKCKTKWWYEHFYYYGCDVRRPGGEEPWCYTRGLCNGKKYRSCADRVMELEALVNKLEKKVPGGENLQVQSAANVESPKATIVMDPSESGKSLKLTDTNNANLNGVNSVDVKVAGLNGESSKPVADGVTEVQYIFEISGDEIFFKEEELRFDVPTGMIQAVYDCSNKGSATKICKMQKHGVKKPVHMKVSVYQSDFMCCKYPGGSKGTSYTNCKEVKPGCKQNLKVSRQFSVTIKGFGYDVAEIKKGRRKLLMQRFRGGGGS